ncbi:MAG: RtcB family protein [Fusobacteriaceae bacterium]
MPIQVKKKNNNMSNIKIFCTSLEETAKQQIEELGKGIYKDNKIRIMPDAHAGKDCVIGTTIQLTDKVTPSLVGVDIGCGVSYCELNVKNIDFQKLDNYIKKHIPSGRNIHEQPSDLAMNIVKGYGRNYGAVPLYCIDYIDLDNAAKSLGTLGGGNHFIEISKLKGSERYFLVVHSGSRKFGKQICDYYQNKAIHACSSTHYDKTKIVIEELKKDGRESEIEETIKRLNSEKEPFIPYLSGKDMLEYVHDIQFAERYACNNRFFIISSIIEHLNSKATVFNTAHNYVDDFMIARKGAISARKNQRFIIPINMKEGSLLCIGKGNPDWNLSAPHGAGRLMSRTQAKKDLDLNNYLEIKNEVYSSTIVKETLDEAPGAYRDMQSIIEAIKDTAEVVDILVPVYNFKAIN